MATVNKRKAGALQLLIPLSEAFGLAHHSGLSNEDPAPICKHLDLFVLLVVISRTGIYTPAASIAALSLTVILKMAKFSESQE